MRSVNLLCLSSVSFAALAMVPAAAYAQQLVDSAAAAEETGVADPAGTNAEGEAASEAIVVTGSRIRRPDEFSATEPLTVITGEEITQSGFNSAADALQSTAVTAGSGQINNYFGGYVTDGGTGANTLGLRNLGPARTLILLNGRRISPAGTRGAVLAADLNVLPTSIIERIEILKAGASSVYGSDAVAGVVNIITDQRVRGLTLDAQVNVPQMGAGVDTRVAGSFGFGTDRLNVIGSLEYRKRNGVRLNDVGFASCPIPGYLDGEDSELGAGDPFPIGDPRNCFTVDNGGVTINTLGLPTRQGIGRTSGVVGNFNRFVPAPGNTTGPTPGFLGVGTYDRDSFDPASQQEFVVTPVETYTGFLSATYDVDALGDAEVYGELLATRRKSSAPLYRQLSLDYLRGSPLLPVEFRNGAFANPNETSSGQIIAARAFIGFGLTDSSQAVDYVRASAGIRGDFFLPEWRYDAYVGRSWTDATYEAQSFLIDRVANSLLVTQNADGSFSCANVASIANCVAAPVLNADTIGGRLPQAFKDYILANTVGTNKFRETTAIFSVDGPLFALPGGDAQLALGAEYRAQRIDDTPDANAISGNLLGLTSSLPTRGKDSVKEVFGEIFLPLLSKRPFFENLNLNASLRYTDYKSYGSDLTYKIAGEWEFVRGFGVRASYGTSYRAPALAEQFLGATSGFLAAANDPCDSGNFPTDDDGNPDPGSYTPNQQLRAANCAAVGLDVATFVQNNGVETFTRGGAEFGLEAETSTNWSAGVVARPPLGSLGSLSLALDYFDIKVENGVSSLTAGTILNRCYGDTAFNPSQGFCRFVVRDANNILTVNSDYVNLSTDIVKGFEFNGRFSSDIAGGQFLLNASVTKYTEQSTRLFPEEFLTDANGSYITPDWTGTFDASYRTGPVTVRYGLDWIDDSSGTYDYLAFDEQTGEVDADLAQAYRDSYRLETPNYFLHSLSVQYDIEDNFQITAGVRNLFDKQPPRISAAVNTIGNAPLYSGYDLFGRSFFVNTSVKF